MNDFIGFKSLLAIGKLKIQCVTLAKQAGIDEVTLLEYYDNDDVN
jgi:hypothetical protein